MPSGQHTELTELRQQFAARDALKDQADEIALELRALLPAANTVTLSEGYRLDAGAPKMPVVQLIVRTDLPVAEPDRERVQAWLKARTRSESVDVVFNASDK